MQTIPTQNVASAVSRAKISQSQNKTVAHCTADMVTIVYANTGSSVSIPYDTSSEQTTEMGKRFQADHLELNPIQRNLYRLLMYGLKEFSPQAQAELSELSLITVTENFRKASLVINSLKYDRIYGPYDAVINHFFDQHTDKITFKGRLGFRPIDSEEVKVHSLRKLGISTRDIVDAFIRTGLLPVDFYALDASSLTL